MIIFKIYKSEIVKVSRKRISEFDIITPENIIKERMPYVKNSSGWLLTRVTSNGLKLIFFYYTIILPKYVKKYAKIIVDFQGEFFGAYVFSNRKRINLVITMFRASRPACRHFAMESKVHDSLSSVSPVPFFSFFYEPLRCPNHCYYGRSPLSHKRFFSLARIPVHPPCTRGLLHPPRR